MFNVGVLIIFSSAQLETSRRVTLDHHFLRTHVEGLTPRNNESFLELMSQLNAA